METSLEQVKQKQNRHSLVVYYLLVLAALIVMTAGLWWAYSPINRGIGQLPAFVSLNWAHEPALLEVLLRMLGMIWLALSCLFWGGWLLRRSVRKIKGQQWRIDRHTSNKISCIAGFFPPVLPYLKISCYYLMLVLLFVILQYPLQFLVF